MTSDGTSELAPSRLRAHLGEIATPVRCVWSIRHAKPSRKIEPTGSRRSRRAKPAILYQIADEADQEVLCAVNRMTSAACDAMLVIVSFVSSYRTAEKTQ